MTDTCKKCGSTEFYANGKCKPCNKVYAATNYIKNKEKIAERNKRWRKQNPDKERAHKVKWYVENSAKLKIYEANRYANNKEAWLIKGQNRRARKLENGGSLSVGLAQKLLILQKGMCACGCGQQLGNKYHLDHRMPLTLGGANEDLNMQLLTPTCNLQKHTKHPVDFMQSRGFLI